MDALEAFRLFVSWAIVPAKRERILLLCDSTSGRKKLLTLLHHEFESIINTSSIRDTSDETKRLERPCYVFCDRMGFGDKFPSITDAYSKLDLDDSWLIISADGKMAIFRPEGRWDDEKQLMAKK